MMINTEADYDRALAEIEHYFAHEPALGAPDDARFAALWAEIEAYEARVWPIDAPDREPDAT